MNDSPRIYERRAEYWTQDLSDRRFEEAIREQLTTLGWAYKDQTSAHHRPDFLIKLPGRKQPVVAALEVKEKRQRYRAGWVDLAGIPEEFILVQDEVSARMLLAHAPRAFLLFWDHLNEAQPYVCFTVLDLFCQPKVRIERPIHQRSPRLKAKWLLDCRNGRSFHHLREVFAFVNTYVARDLVEELQALAPHRPAMGESIDRL